MSKIDVDESIKEVDKGALPSWIADHLRTYQESGGKEGHMWDSTAAGGKGLLPCLLLHTVGRKSGREFVHPLIYGVSGESFIIVGSKGGAPTQPGWYFNLIENPKVSIQVGVDSFSVTARLMEGNERSDAWTQMVDLYPPYEDYQAKTSRLIPLFILER
ncbi:MAG: nitroreductase family deazaflavin-dependent oxidoreductase [Pseudomonadota bacterium]